jgi:3-methylcrotonyl-CoA carboxylase alpha subunit
MGSKSASKNIMNAAGVRCVPGYHGEAQDNDTLFKEAEKTGYPIMLKAVLGGGGKGMRIVRSPDEFLEAVDGCRREALASFKDDRVLLERYIENPRHIEFQVFADKQGNAVHLYERDCSVQRRHQKVFEEAPAPAMSEELRAQMGKSATDAAKAVGYVGAGTVEFIFDADTNEYFFMEMNTRLQVEHCVSEMIVHRDLVQWQLHVAAGHRLPVQSQADIKATGHALELRVYAENPYNNFFPATGKLVHMSAPEVCADVRVETGVRQGDEVSIHYDPMISKLVVWAPNREACLKRMARAIEDYQIVGPPTNLSFARRVLDNKAFQHGEVTTKFIPTYLDELVPPVAVPSSEVTMLAVMQMLLKEQETQAKSLWANNASFRINDLAPVRKVTLELAGQGTGDKKDTVTVWVKMPKHAAKTGSLYVEMSLDGETYVPVQGGIDAEGRVQAMVGLDMLQADVVPAKDGEVHVFSNHGAHHTFRVPTKVFGSAVAAGGGAIAPMAGKIIKVNVKAGDSVKMGQALVVMEAMKMEHVLKAPADGVIKSCLFTAGDFVEGGKPVVIFAEKDDE